MRILVVTESVPWPPGYGGAMRSIEMLRAIASQHEVTLSCPLAEEHRPAAEAGLTGLVSHFAWVPRDFSRPVGLKVREGRAQATARLARDLIAHPATPMSFRQRTRQWQSAIAALAPSIDGVFCRSAINGLLGCAAGLARTIVDSDDLHSSFHATRARARARGRFMAVVDRIEAGRARAAERRFARQAAQLLLSSEDDHEKVGPGRITVVPNGISLGPLTVGSPRDPDLVLFVGACAWEPNQDGLHWFLSSVWPLLRAARPATRLLIVGRDATLSTVPLAAQEGVGLAPDVPSVAPYYRRATVAIAPLRFAAGTRIKILESLGYGIPMISTTAGASGLDDRLRLDHGLTIRDDPAGFAAALETTLDQPGPCLAQAERGAALVRAAYSWEAATRPVREHLGAWLAPRRS